MNKKELKIFRRKCFDFLLEYESRALDFKQIQFPRPDGKARLLIFRRADGRLAVVEYDNYFRMAKKYIKNLFDSGVPEGSTPESVVWTAFNVIWDWMERYP